MTTAAMAFADGKILTAFYIQPAAAFLCLILAIIAFLALLSTIFGIYYKFLRRFSAEIKTRYIILALVIVIVAGWAVILARALADADWK